MLGEKKIINTYHVPLYPGYLKVNSSSSGVGYSTVKCNGSEERLEKCEIGNLTSHNCSQIAVILQCFNGNIHEVC